MTRFRFFVDTVQFRCDLIEQTHGQVDVHHDIVGHLEKIRFLKKFFQIWLTGSIEHSNGEYGMIAS